MTYQKSELELASDLHPLENIEQETLNKKIKKDKERFEQIVTTQNKIQQIKADLNSLIHAMNHNSSLFSRAALFWNDVPLWQKIIGGVVLSVPFLIVGILANFAALITLSIVTAISYTVSSFLLENHQSQNTDNTERLNAGISSLADLLDMVISSLERLREQLAIEVESFQKENARLTGNIEQFSEQVKTLTAQVNNLTDTEKNLRLTQEDLENTTKKLKDAAQEQSELLEDTQKKLEQAIQDYKENQTLLSDKIKELDEVKVRMGKDIEYARSIGLVLGATIDEFSAAMIQGEEQRVAFKERLEGFLTNKEASFDKIVSRISDAEHQLARLKDEYALSNQRHKELLCKFEQMICRHEQVILQHESHVFQLAQIQELYGFIKSNIHGFFATKKEMPLLAEQTNLSLMASSV